MTRGRRSQVAGVVWERAEVLEEVPGPETAVAVMAPGEAEMEAAEMEAAAWVVVVASARAGRREAARVEAAGTGGQKGAVAAVEAAVGKGAATAAQTAVQTAA